ncbi:hypothetical protein GCM10011482_01550 [Enterococcus alcedinis]|uniref:Glycosyltransferase 2-like domain-containing protein n=1 Tax=Enterococcus alcedinis TaxID=1274384 RepID=A0A917JD22_9ENTE|nr:glycosyltransferase family 2 protein [Enterococcus alcedinis]MBP2101200.1 glycosyltransferase involved in cell wall biosynthesis [Enterococcus alcedinis]GGI64501.1 hypothetical protein GCM10011482_01550 [Enterococcus alcedinis]
MKKEKVSIIVPMYNVAEYITDCLKSILNQTYLSIEIILIDDGSTDDTLQIANDVTKNEEKVFIYSTDNHGPAHARNFGIQRATGEYIMFVDSDDYLPPKAVNSLVEAAILDNSLLVVGRTVRTNGDKTWDVASHQKYQLNQTRKKVNIEKCPELFFAIGPAAKLYHHSLIDNQTFDESIRFAEDQLFVLQTYLKAKKISIVSEIVYYYRVRQTANQSLTQTYSKQAYENLKNILMIINQACELIYEQNNYSQNEKEQLFIAYVNRLCEIELRVLFKSIYRQEGKQQKKFFQSFLKGIEKKPAIFELLVNQSVGFNNYIKNELYQFYFLIKKQAFPSYIKIVKQINLWQKEDTESDLTTKIIASNGSQTKILSLKLMTALNYLVSRLGRRMK